MITNYFTKIDLNVPRVIKMLSDTLSNLDKLNGDYIMLSVVFIKK